MRWAIGGGVLYKPSIRTPRRRLQLRRAGLDRSLRFLPVHHFLPVSTMADDPPGDVPMARVPPVDVLAAAVSAPRRSKRKEKACLLKNTPSWADATAVIR